MCVAAVCRRPSSNNNPRVSQMTMSCLHYFFIVSVFRVQYCTRADFGLPGTYYTWLAKNSGIFFLPNTLIYHIVIASAPRIKNTSMIRL